MKEFVPTNRRNTARKKCPWAVKIVPDYFGFWCYESEYEYLVHQTTLKEEKKEGNK
jgi:hypothetical protein